MIYSRNDLEGRKPTSMTRIDGEPLLREAERQYLAVASQPPPRATRFPEPEVDTGPCIDSDAAVGEARDRVVKRLGVRPPGRAVH